MTENVPSTDHRPPTTDRRPSEIDLLHELVRIPSVSGDEGEAARYLVEQMAARGFESFVDGAGNAVGIVGAGRPEIVLLGHIDTVPGEIPVRIEEGRLYGRGAVDAKGPLAAFVCAAARLHESGRLRGRIVVIGCVEEEAPSSRGAHYAVSRYRPDVCIVGEPSGWDRVTLGYKGVLRIRARFEQAYGHSAHERRTATERVVALWQRIQTSASEANVSRERIFDQLQPALLGIDSDSDGLDESAVAEISLRLPPGIAPESAAAEIAAIDPAIRIEILGGVAAYESPRGTAPARALTQAIRERGGRPRLVLKTGTADMNIVGPAWGCPTVAYGPGDAALDHTPAEHIELDAYLRAIDVLEAALARLGSSAA
jgi:[amino group carrier protein]-lysine/ornithine hydrolase